jgi:PAS domain-containing protein
MALVPSDLSGAAPVPGDTAAGTTSTAAVGEPLRRDAERYARTGAGASLDRLADLARRLLGTGSAQVSLLTDVQLVAGGAGVSSDAVGSTGTLVDSLCTVTAQRGSPLEVIDAAADDRVNSLPPVQTGAVGSYLGVPLLSTRGQVVGALCVFDPAPRTWDPSDVELLTNLSRSVVAELELDALSGEYARTVDRWELAIDAAGVGSFDWDLRTGELVWDARLLALFGYAPDEFGRTIEDFNARVHPEDLPRVGANLQHAVDACGTVDMEYRIVLPDGATRWIAARGRAMADDDGKAVG